MRPPCKLSSCFLGFFTVVRPGTSWTGKQGNASMRVNSLGVLSFLVVVFFSFSVPSVCLFSFGKAWLLAATHQETLKPHSSRMDLLNITTNWKPCQTMTRASSSFFCAPVARDAQQHGISTATSMLPSHVCFSGFRGSANFWDWVA